MNDWDVLVIGAGGAGLAAAVSAAEAGASVAIIESEKEIGGSTQLSSGMFTAADTSVQRALDVGDSAERFFQHYMDLNQWRLRPGLIWEFCAASGPTLEWLRAHGVEFPAVFSTNAHEPGLTQAGVEDVWRGHVPRDQGYGIVQALNQSRLSKNVDLILNTRVEDLLINNGRVSGIKADGAELPASAVVVASGGLAHDKGLLKEYYPEALEAGDDLFVVAAAGSRGDHINFAKTASAAIDGQGWGLLLVTSYLQRLHHWQSGFPPRSRIYINQAGLRFMNEDISYAVSPRILRDNGGTVWNVFDEQGRLSLDPGYAHWTPANVKNEAASGRLPSSETLNGLAAQIGVPEHNLLETVRIWNTQLPSQSDPDYMRDATLRNKGVNEPIAPIVQPPFYAARTRPAELVCTHAGLAIDSKARARDEFGEPVPGLYAAGEAGAGVLGDRYVGGGNSIANALTFGRIAGASAAAYAAGL